MRISLSSFFQHIASSCPAPAIQRNELLSEEGISIPHTAQNIYFCNNCIGWLLHEVTQLESQLMPTLNLPVLLLIDVFMLSCSCTFALRQIICQQYRRFGVM
jgi:hypothetical protein